MTAGLSSRVATAKDRIEDMDVIRHAEPVRDREEQGVGSGDGFVVPELLDQDVEFGGVGAAESGAHRVDDAQLVAVVIAVAETVGQKGSWVTL